MRPLLINLDGFGAFSQPSVVDLTDVDFFALVGPTGAGKSTILDAICFALYGKAPRWNHSVAYALAPSATTGKVRLVFSANGGTYVATRIAKRAKDGKVKTDKAALERLPADLTATDMAELDSLIGTSLAASPKQVDEAVERVLGLRYEEFIKCVLLPQGDFAQFLHSKPADRKQILKKILGHGEYDKIQTAAGERKNKAEAVLAHIERQLSELPDIGNDDIVTAAQTVTDRQKLQAEIESRIPALDELKQRADDAAEALRQLDEEQALLTYIKQPTDVAALAHELERAREEHATAQDDHAAAERAEERLRHSSDSVDVARYAQLKLWHEQVADLAEKLRQGEVWTDNRRRLIDEAQQRVDAASAAVTDAETAYESAQLSNLVGSILPSVEVGAACPVCAQTVPHAPSARPAPELDQARAGLRDARQRLEEATKERDHHSNKLAGFLDSKAEKEHELESLRQRLIGVDDQATVEEKLAQAERDKKQLADASVALKHARSVQQRKDRAVKDAERRFQQEWEKFDHHRDRVAALQPPSTDRTDLASSWQALCTWAQDQLEVRQDTRRARNQDVSQLDTKLRTVHNALFGVFAQYEVTPPRGTDPDGSQHLETAKDSVREAESRLERLRAQHRQIIDLRDDQAAHAREAQIAKQLHQHLNARHFINWLLEEAVAELVAGASQILLRLSSERYELDYSPESHDFYVVDHHDGGMQRPVRTLSGGETFAASLALALALSDQLAGLSSKGAALESILLDEGFGTLDSATLDQVAANLESLAGSKGRMVGVVTHVQALAERIPVRFDISRDVHGSHVHRSSDEVSHL